MPTSRNAALYYEAAQTIQAMTALTDQGDHKEFRSADNLWSKRSGYVPDVKPNGVADGGLVSVAASGSNDVVDVAAMNVYLAGVKTAVAASTDLSVPRPSTSTSNYQKLSITVTAAGAIAVVEGTEGAAFSDTRGAAGGPAWIPTGSVEVAQVWYSSLTSAAVLAAEIKQVVGTHRETYSYPQVDIVYGEVDNGILGYAGVDFVSALPLIHSDDDGSTTATKKVYASYYTPVFAELSDASEFVPPANSHSLSSKQVYGRTIGSTSASINQGTFNAELQDGISDGLLSFLDEVLWFKFKQDRLNDPYILCQGVLGVGTSFPAGDSITASCTIGAETTAMRVTTV